MIFTGNANPVLAAEIAQHTGATVGSANVGRFSDGEVSVEITQNVRARDVFVIQSTCAPTNDNLMELIIMVDALKRASAERISAVIPYFGYARQDRRPRSSRVPITAKVVANMLQTVGVSRVLTMDLHADQIQGFFDVPVDHLYSSFLFLEHLQKMDLGNLVMATPDVGGTRRANAYAKALNVDLAICYKQRKVVNQVDSMTVIGDVEGKDVVLVDDIIDTGGTLCKAADMMLEHGARSVRACITHPLLSGNAHENIRKSKLTELMVTDTIPLREQNDKITVISVAELFADVIRKAHNYESISTKFIF